MAGNRMTWLKLTLTRAGLVLCSGACTYAAAPTKQIELEKQYNDEVRPLVQQYCLGCHSTEKHKGDMDLERFASFQEVLKHPKAWQQVVEQLSLGEMPPKGKPRPEPGQVQHLLGWINDALDQAVLTRAGDPGPVVLRRLNNAEYTYTVRDLTEVDTLDPVKEFPTDSAAGEGFMNTGGSLVMSPALLSKYFDAAKEIASHAVLLPDGIRFSPKTSRRDWTEEILTEIRALYRQFTDPEGADKVNLQGIVLDTNKGGRLPLERYLRALLDYRAVRQSPTDGNDGPELSKLANTRGLSPKYLTSLWSLLNGGEPSPLLDEIRARWRRAAPEDAVELAGHIGQWQKALWKFSSVGHIGKLGGPKAWMEPVNPLVDQEEFHLKLAAPTNRQEVVIYLVANDAGDGNAGDFVVWQQPRLVVPGHPNLFLRDARDFIREMSARRQRLFASAEECLVAAAEIGTSTQFDLAELARQHRVETDTLKAWLGYLGLDSSATLSLDHLINQISKAGGYDFVQGWGSLDTPNLVANSSDQHVRIPGNLDAHSVALHPSPKLNAAIGWCSPGVATVRVQASVTHAHPECGNGVEWFVEVRRGNSRVRLAKGVAQGGKEVRIGPFENLALQRNDLVSLLIGPRDGNHACDLTKVELAIEADNGRQWSLTRDVADSILAGNPHSDVWGNATWHFYAEPVSNERVPFMPAGSLLARWQFAANPKEKHHLASAIQTLLTTGPLPSQAEGPDRELYQQLSSLSGPFASRGQESPAQGVARLEAGTHSTLDDVRAKDSATHSVSLPGSGAEWSLDPAGFGRHPNGSPIDAASLCVQAPSVIEIRLPAELVAGTEFVTTARLDSMTGAEGSVQLEVTTNAPTAASGLLVSGAKVSDRTGPWTSDNRQVSYRVPIVVNEGSQARKRIENGFDQFRRWFPAALCYEKIVPVDEVITLILFHREDEPLCRLMLDDLQRASLDRLWDELRFVSRDALTLVDAFDQLWQYATQDADPKVFEPLRQPIRERAAAFRKRLADTQPKQLAAVLEFANRAYRRPLTDHEVEELRSLYAKLRAEELPHEEAIQFTLARVLVAPAFLYRLETAGPGSEPVPVSSWELASRLSYFLWSSTPDPELLEAARTGRLCSSEALTGQARRMLHGGRVRRLATEFACAWLQIHDFDELNEKSERHFPTFATLRGPMYEEAIRFFTELFQNDGSVLDIYDADHTFLNETLAKCYGIPGVAGPEWRRVDGVKKFGRGGVLGLGATLAKESGASRTSPILRGNWVSEVLLGDRLPRPPKDVPRLPEDEAAENLTVRQLVEKHSSDERCATCHKRIDGFGFALEGYDAIGRARTRDLADRPIETHATLLDGTMVEDADGLRSYLLTKKREAVLRQFCRKLLGYALGRSVLLSDKPLVTEMQHQLTEHDFRFSAAVETIVRSRQFLDIRGKDMTDED
jgi:hypothetical protein